MDKSINNAQNVAKQVYSGVVETSPLKIYEFFSLVVFLCFYSPIIIITSVVSLSFVFQNFKGFIYLGFLLASLLGREAIYGLFGSKPLVKDGTICSSIEYSKYGNPAFSSFVFSFTILYLSIPMFSNGAPNFWIFFALIVYFLLDMGIKMYKRCIVHMGDLFINVLFGGALASIIVMSMFAGGSSKFLFFNEISSNKDVCTMPSKQTFKCKMYKDGTLIGDV
jgi:hypothetical protein